MIPRQLQSAFPEHIRARGDEYFTSRQVRVVRAEPRSVIATVEDSEIYDVLLDARPGAIGAFCSCPAARDDGLCMHIWATLRFTDANAQLDPLLARAGDAPRMIALDAFAARLTAVAAGADHAATENVEDASDSSDASDTFDAADSVDDGPSPDELLVDELIAELIPARRPSPRGASKRRSAAPPTPAPSAARPQWKVLLEGARRQMGQANGEGAEDVALPNDEWPADRRLVYVIDVPATTHALGVVVDVETEKRTTSGGWEPPLRYRLNPDSWLASPDPADQMIAQMLAGALPPSSHDRHTRTAGYVLRGAALPTTLRAICDTGRCRLRATPGERPTNPLRWDSGAPWTLRLRVAAQKVNCYAVSATLERGGRTMPIAEPVVLHVAGVLIAHGCVARFEHGGAFAFVTLFRQRPTIVIGADELPSLLESLYAMPHLPALDLPPEARVSEQHEPPVPNLTLITDTHAWRAPQHRLELSFRYGTAVVQPADRGATIFDRGAKVIRHRDVEFEQAALERLLSLGAREMWASGSGSRALVVAPSRLGALITELAAAGWRVDAEGVPFRVAGEARASVRSGIDWFELHAGVRYGDQEVSLGDLLAARHRGAQTITLADGSQGLLPIDWLARLGPIIAGGALVDGTMRYARSQVALLDALLATLPDADVDATFETARVEMRNFDRVAASDPEASFCGELREYQREGLGWLHFLRRFQLGGCLADDMGLGKTVQVLALLDARRASADADAARDADIPRRPSIVVVPRSLVVNWMREAQRFTPKLRFLDHTGMGRRVDAIDASNADVVITTYGTLRRDAAALAAVHFDYAILDEAQAIKNASSASAKAARLLRADHRLAMTGTPIENSLNELWSLFEFLNPGMLGKSSAFSRLLRLTDAADGPAGREVLARALRPVILRRTKEQVASDLPPRVEQTLTVELEGSQRKFYDGLLESYRNSVLDRVDRVGLRK